MTLRTRHPDLVQFVCSVSRPLAERNAGWTGRTGRINLLIEEDPGPLEFAEGRYAHYLCGDPGTIEDASTRLTSNGWLFVTERFWRSTRRFIGRVPHPRAPAVWSLSTSTKQCCRLLHVLWSEPRTLLLAPVYRRRVDRGDIDLGRPQAFEQFAAAPVRSSP